MTYGLGRRLNHDERSRAFPARTATQLKSVRHKRWIPALDQGAIGSCTGHAMTGALYTAPVYGRAWRKIDSRQSSPILHGMLAEQLYSEATIVDPFPGIYPPEDTGSSGLAVCKAAQARGLIKSYRWAFGIDQALAALVLGPVLLGVNWRQDMFTPNAKGIVTYSGPIVGGHEFMATGLNVRTRMVECWNSWGPQWGSQGRFYLPFDELDRALKEDGDACVVNGDG